MLFVGAAALGAVLRYVASARLPGNAGTAVATLYINIIGSFLLGLLSTRTGDTQTVAGVGALGAFTTFSTFVLIIVSYEAEGKRRAACGYVMETLVLCTAAAWVGITAADQGWT